MKRTKKGLKNIKAGCYYLYKEALMEEFIIYVKSVKRIGSGFDIDRKIWSPTTPFKQEGLVRYVGGIFPIIQLRCIPEKTALLKIAAWML